MEKSRNIMLAAIEEYRPQAIVALVSGGKDSSAAFQVALETGVKIDAVLHVNTRTGIKETTDFVRNYYGNLSVPYIEADAGTAYEDYVMRKGFFGRGIKSHAYAYHLLKADPLRKAISKHFRQRRRNYNVLLINGARHDEGANRKKRKRPTCDPDPSAKSNIFTSVIEHWSANDRDIFLKKRNIPLNPVAEQICRSGECMCGTMQSIADRAEASVVFPEWGQWLNDLEDKVTKKFPWKWGVAPTISHFNGQTDLFQPMCEGCNNKVEIR